LVKLLVTSVHVVLFTHACHIVVSKFQRLEQTSLT